MLWKSLVISGKVIIYLPYNPVVSFLSIYSRKLKLYPQKHLSSDIHYSFTLSSQKLKITQCPSLLAKRIRKWISLANGILLRHKKACVIDTCNGMDDSDKALCKGNPT
jgi:hypothetical protein